VNKAPLECGEYAQGVNNHAGETIRQWAKHAAVHWVLGDQDNWALCRKRIFDHLLQGVVVIAIRDNDRKHLVGQVSHRVAFPVRMIRPQVFKECLGRGIRHSIRFEGLAQFWMD